MGKATTKTPLPRKKCKYAPCGCLFTPYREWQEYHNNKCRARAYRATTKDKHLKALQRRVLALEKTIDELRQIIALNQFEVAWEKLKTACGKT